MLHNLVGYCQAAHQRELAIDTDGDVSVECYECGLSAETRRRPGKCGGRTTKVERDTEAGKWVPSYHGNRYRIVRLLRDRLRTQQCGEETFDTLAEAKAEANRRNGTRGVK